MVQVEVGGVRRHVNAGLFEPGEIGVGDWVLIHVGFVLSKVSETEARDQLRLLAELGEAGAAMDEVRGYA
jgi:hydrogenase expression/formation protein HypC